MTRDKLFKMHQDTCAMALLTMKKKNHDYAESEDPFQNFKGSKNFGVHPVVGVLLRVEDKMQRINTFARKGTLAVENESVDDAIEDVINYMILIKGLISEEKNERTSNDTVEHSGVPRVQADVRKAEGFNRNPFSWDLSSFPVNGRVG